MASGDNPRQTEVTDRLVQVPIGNIVLPGNLAIPPNAHGIVLFAHGSGSSRHSPRNRFVARELNRIGLATLLIDLLTSSEEAVDLRTRHLRFDIDLLAGRLAAASSWLQQNPGTLSLPMGYFGASTGAAAALSAAADYPGAVRAVVSRGGRPDLAGAALARVLAPTLLIVGEQDPLVITLNEEALVQLRSIKQLAIVPHATHLFEEPGALEMVAQLAGDWFNAYLKAAERER